MKFSNGCWLQKQGTECFSPSEVYFTTVEEGKVTLCAPTSKIETRGSTLGGVNLTIVITSPMPEVIRVQAAHYLGVQKKAPEFELNISDKSFLEVVDSEDKIVMSSGTLRLEIEKASFKMTYYRGNEKLTDSGKKDLAYMKSNWQGLAYDDGSEQDTYMRQQLSIGVGELLYGTGERFTPFVKNGQSVEIWNADGGTSTEQSYKNIPFYLSNKGYGVFVNHPEKVEFELGTEMVTKAEFSVPGERLDYFLFDGPTMKEVLKRYTDLTGKPALPAPWTFGLWLSTSFTTNYDEATVNSFVDGMIARDIPLAVFHFDCFWMKDFCWSDFTWDARVFPDPVGMLARLKAKGLKICVWINSYIGQESILFKEGMENGYFLKRKNGDVWQWDMWQPGMALVDFTNKKACQWYQDKLEVLLDMGVDCFKTDFGERIPVDAVYSDGSDPTKMHNYYTYLYNKTVYELLERKRGKGEAVLFARSATAGGQKFPVHWGGDCWSDYESMEESLRGGLSLTMSGFGYWSHDIGGFESTSTPDVYKRWCAFGLLSSHSRLHGSTSYRVPWVYDEEAVDVVRHFAKLKASLMPYIYKNAIETSQSGIPMMRSMVLEYTSDKNCAYLDKQYMFGDSFLVAPILNAESLGEYYLPEGTWTHYFTGEIRCGGKWYSEPYDYFSLPLFVKENSLIAVGKDTGEVYNYAEAVTIRAYELMESSAAKTVVYNEHAQEEIKAEIVKSGDEIKISVQFNSADNEKNSCRIVLVNVTNAKISEHSNAEQIGEDTVITVRGTSETVLILV